MNLIFSSRRDSRPFPHEQKNVRLSDLLVGTFIEPLLKLKALYISDRSFNTGPRTSPKIMIEAVIPGRSVCRTLVAFR
jgi:hypothetical protein